jgi:uncharacterized protein (TIGR00730 family)
MAIKNICIYCGASKGSSPVYAEAARQLADVILKAGLSLVYGGGNVGLMGELADRMISQGGKVIGVIPQFLVEKEVAHTQLTELHIVESMSERKKWLHEISDAYILLPGGIGSLDEFFETITLSQLGIHNKPRGILNTASYYDNLLKFLDHSVEQNFWNATNRDRVIVEENPQKLLSAVMNYQAPVFSRWVDMPAEKV